MAGKKKTNHQLTSTMEDYLEAIWCLNRHGKIARLKDISHLIGVAPATANAAMKYLKKRALIEQENYGYIELTERGKRIASKILKRHKLLVRFLQEILGLEKEIAEADACRLEHCVSPQTVERLVKFLDFLDTYYARGDLPQWLEAFYQQS